MKRRTIFHMKHAYHVVKPFSLKPLSSFGPGDHLSHQFFTDFFFIFSICLNDDVCRRSYFSRRFSISSAINSMLLFFSNKGLS